MSISAVADVQSRIAAITARFGGGITPAVSTSTTASTSSTAFAAELDTAGSRLSGSSTAASASTRATASSRTSSAAGPSGADVVAQARRYLGVPYVRGGNTPASGLDCSGLTELVYANLGIDLPPVSWEQARAGQRVDSMADARAGDLVFFGKPVGHVGIYIGDGKMIHAPRAGKDVQVASVYETPTAIRRLIGGPGAAVSASSAAASSAASTASASSGATGPFADLFRRAGAKYGVPAGLLSAVAKVESGYRADAVSPAGARGLMQIMPGTARELGVDPMDPAQAVDGAARLLKRDLAAFGSTELALAAYNAGAGAVRRYDGIPPYRETQNYVRKVMAAYGGGS